MYDARLLAAVAHHLLKFAQEHGVVLVAVVVLKFAVFLFVLFPIAVARFLLVVQSQQVLRAAIEAALATEAKELVIVAQRDAAIEAPTQDDLYAVGTKVVIRKMAQSPDGGLQLIVQGIERAEVVQLE